MLLRSTATSPFNCLSSSLHYSNYRSSSSSSSSSSHSCSIFNKSSGSALRNSFATTFQFRNSNFLRQVKSKMDDNQRTISPFREYSPSETKNLQKNPFYRENMRELFAMFTGVDIESSTETQQQQLEATRSREPSVASHSEGNGSSLFAECPLIDQPPLWVSYPSQFPDLKKVLENVPPEGYNLFPLSFLLLLLLLLLLFPFHIYLSLVSRRQKDF